MTNIIKKIKRKHKKKKLQAEYAKMEQSRQNRTPEDAYQERLSKHRSAAILCGDVRQNSALQSGRGFACE